MVLVAGFCSRTIAFFSWILFMASNTDASGPTVQLLPLYDSSEPGTVALLPPTSPECWRQAIQVFDFVQHLTEDSKRTNDYTTAGSANSICNSMTPDHQKLLALELSRCHLQDLGRSLVVANDEDATFFCQRPGEGSFENLSTCLTKLSDVGMTSYTHFFTYVNQLCTRLLQEVLLLYYYKTSHDLAKSSETAQERLVLMVQQQEQMMDTWEQRDETLLTLHDRLQLQLQEQSNLLMRKVASLEQELEQHQQIWLKEDAEVRQNQTLELSRHRQELERLAQAISQTHQSIKPWSLGFFNSLEQVRKGYNSLIFVLNILGSMTVIWVTTFPKICRRLRVYLHLILFLVTYIEWNLKNDSQLSNNERSETIANLRDFALTFSCLLYILWWIVSLLCWRSTFHDRSRVPIPSHRSRVTNPSHKVLIPCHTVPIPHHTFPISRQDYNSTVLIPCHSTFPISRQDSDSTVEVTETAPFCVNSDWRNQQCASAGEWNCHGGTTFDQARSCTHTSVEMNNESHSLANSGFSTNHHFMSQVMIPSNTGMISAPFHSTTDGYMNPFSNSYQVQGQSPAATSQINVQSNWPGAEERMNSLPSDGVSNYEDPMEASENEAQLEGDKIKTNHDDAIDDKRKRPASNLDEEEPQIKRARMI